MFTCFHHVCYSAAKGAIVSISFQCSFVFKIIISFVFCYIATFSWLSVFVLNCSSVIKCTYNWFRIIGKCYLLLINVQMMSEIIYEICRIQHFSTFLNKTSPFSNIYPQKMRWNMSTREPQACRFQGEYVSFVCESEESETKNPFFIHTLH